MAILREVFWLARLGHAMPCLTTPSFLFSLSFHIQTTEWLGYYEKKEPNQTKMKWTNTPTKLVIMLVNTLYSLYRDFDHVYTAIKCKHVELLLFFNKLMVYLWFVVQKMRKMKIKRPRWMLVRALENIGFNSSAYILTNYLSLWPECNVRFI